MKKKDGRALSHRVREEIRKRAVERVLGGESPEEVVAALGFHRSRIYAWLAKYREGGEQALQTKPIEGRPRKLSEKYARALREYVLQDPRQLDFHDALWTREMIRELIATRFGVNVSVRTVSNILQRLGMSVQRPRLRAYEQDPDAVKTWLEDDWPAIQREAKAAGASVFFGDEANMRSDYHKATTWGVKGETPVVQKTGRRFSINMISAISPRGELRFMLTEARVNATVFITFLRRLLYGAERPIFLVLDGHPVHRSKAVRAFVQSSNGMLKIFLLPGYSPELNPDELVWHYLKRHRLTKAMIETKDQLMERARSVLRSMQKRADLLRSFFRESHVAYINM